ncbi:multi-copper polyphenol oxidoreductase laccase family protein [Collimonas arenae]|uniref:Purine nucleoside phosphorylase n=1 Tax=Collimonas arenae TaxID=279058 RepID=A0A127PRQ4_9BURK|nr:peptidoglycan editing factor PgeF [Collimonas arenae]AMP00487.1 multi-copper polyphenol oxidoreductase laccase family protein [Collimonas arenae]AMP10368.1 multi-copper polyphenol oxidoreductase laccase family protein [Collimonas arenae]
MQLIIPDWANVPQNVGALSTTRVGGTSQDPYGDGSGGGGLNLGAHVDDAPQAVASNRALLAVVLPAEPVWMTQVHGSHVVDADSAAIGVEADAAITTRPGVVCAVQTADCLPVLFADLHGRVVGAAHAGWRGLVGGVLQNTVARMRQAGAEQIVAWLGPAIGPGQFEVGADVLTAFVDAAQSMQAEPQVLVQTRDCFRPIAARPGKYLADIYELARIALRQAGVEDVYGGGLCTVADRTFYSYRRDRVTGRMASLIWLK